MDPSDDGGRAREACPARCLSDGVVWATAARGGRRESTVSRRRLRCLASREQFDPNHGSTPPAGRAELIVWQMAEQLHNRVTVRGVGIGKHGTLIASVACPHRGEGSSQTEASQRRTCATVGLVPVPVSLISSSLSIYDVGVVSCADASVSGPGASPLYIYDKGLGVSAAAGATSGHL